MKIKCGVVCVLGKPNAGKSSLVNAIVKEKVSIVSPKPQTTRNNILGVYNDDNSQVVFVDTPGLNVKSTGLDNFMQKSIKGATEGTNAVVLCVDITKGITKKEQDLINNYNEKNIPVILAITKIDLVNNEKVFEFLNSNAELSSKCELVPVTSLKHKNMDVLLNVIKKCLPEVDEEERLFGLDDYTDKPLNFIVAELIRESALYKLEHEIPHGIAVLVESFKEEENIVNIDALIVCDKDSHKAIILGKGGSMLKAIGHDARVNIQKLLHKKVNLNLFIKVKPNWKNNLEFLDSLGYNINEI